MSYVVGQVLYVVLRKEARVYPMQVVEEITKKTLEGEVTTHMVRAGINVDKVLAITEIDGEVFDSAEKAKNVLIERASNAISSRVDDAIAKAKEWYPTGTEHVSDDPMTLIRKVTTVSGVTAPIPITKAKRGKISSELATLDAELRAESQEAELITLPDGTKAKVRSIKVPPSMQG